MPSEYGGVPCPKPPKRETKAPTRIRVTRKPLSERNQVAEIRAYVIGRERGRCRCCRMRRGDSMHELRPRSIGGKVSRKNSIWVCGDGTSGCHGYLQRHDIHFDYTDALEAERALTFQPLTESAADWMKVKRWITIYSAPMVEIEAAE